MKIEEIAHKVQVFSYAMNRAALADTPEFWISYSQAKKNLLEDNAPQIRLAAEAYCGTNLPLGFPEDTGMCPMARALNRNVDINFDHEVPQVVLFAMAFDNGHYPDLVDPEYWGGRMDDEIVPPGE